MPIAFVPAVYEHAAACIGRTPSEVAFSPELLYEAHARAYTMYRHTPILPVIDIYSIEAEAYGARITRPEGEGLPVVEAPILDEIGALRSCRHYDPARDGRLPGIVEAALRLQETFPEAEVRVPLCGPLSIAAGLLGHEELLCGLLEEPDEAAAGLLHLAEGQAAACAYLKARGLEAVVFESGAAPPLVSPGAFAECVRPALGRMMEAAREHWGRAPGLVLGGDTARILPALLAMEPGGLICPAETDQAAFMETLRAAPEGTGMPVRINLPSSVFVSGTEEDVQEALRRCLSLAEGFERAQIGCGVVPYGMDPARVRFVAACFATLQEGDSPSEYP